VEIMFINLKKFDRLDMDNVDKIIHNQREIGFLSKTFFVLYKFVKLCFETTDNFMYYFRGSMYMKGKEVGTLLKYFLPNEHVKSVFHITPEHLKEKGIKGIITDLDNTLVEWDRPSATPDLIEWFENMKNHSIHVTIVSNNNENRVKRFAEPLGIPFICDAKKPLSYAFQRAIRLMDLKKEEVVVIGDQLLTDVFGGNFLGLHTILVVPVAKTDGFFTRINRKMERKLLSVMKRKGMIYWEE